MQRRSTLFLVLAFLLSQLASLSHVYAEHLDDSGNNEFCEICLASNSLDHAVISALPALTIAASYDAVTQPLVQVHPSQHLQYFSARAPPRFL